MKEESSCQRDFCAAHEYMEESVNELKEINKALKDSQVDLQVSIAKLTESIGHALELKKDVTKLEEVLREEIKENRTEVNNLKMLGLKILVGIVVGIAVAAIV